MNEVFGVNALGVKRDLFCHVTVSDKVKNFWLLVRPPSVLVTPLVLLLLIIGNRWYYKHITYCVKKYAAFLNKKIKASFFNIKPLWKRSVVFGNLIKWTDHQDLRRNLKLWVIFNVIRPPICVLQFAPVYVKIDFHYQCYTYSHVFIILLIVSRYEQTWKIFNCLNIRMIYSPAVRRPH